MIRQLGLATLFVTLSAAETGWPDLYPMVKTEVLQSLSCDPSESQKHANNLKNIKYFLTDLIHVMTVSL
jgi:hypothetical protein